MFNKSSIQIGISPLTWSNDDLPEIGADITYEQCIKEMSMAGYKGCEIGHKFPRDHELLKKSLDQYDLQVASAWYSTYFTEMGRKDETEIGFIQHMEFLKLMGAKVIVVAECGHCTQLTELPILSHKPIFTEKQWQMLFEGMEGLGKIAKQNDMKIVYHYHMGTGVQTQAEIDTLMDNTNPEYVSLLLDTAHLYFTGGNSTEVIQQYKNRIQHVHLKDIRSDVLQAVNDKNLSFLSAVREGVFTVPGDGCIQFEPIFKALSDINYEGWFVVEAEQDPKKAPPLHYAQLGRAHINELTGL